MDYWDYNGIFKGYLNFDENLIWSQEPKIRLFRNYNVDRKILFTGTALVIAGIAVIFLPLNGSHFDIRFFAGFMPFLFGCFVIKLAFRCDKKYFAVTDRRILILNKRAFDCVELKDVKHVMFNRSEELVVYTRLSKNFPKAVLNDYNSYEITATGERYYCSGQKNYSSDSVVLAIKEKPEIVQEVKDIIIRQAGFLQNRR